MSGFATEERRLVFRVDDYWNFLRQEREFPRVSDIDPVELGDDWCDCFVIRPAETPAESVFLFVGPRLLENALLPEDWARSAVRRLRDCPAETMLGRAVKYFGDVLAQRQPITVAELFHENGEEAKLRGPLFPLSHNVRDIDAILGAANCARLEALRLGESAA